MSESKQDVIIIGAGIAGLMAAGFLHKQGIDFAVLDKGRGVGGRMASRRMEPGRADHGAQFFTVRTDRFRAYVDEWLAAGAVVEWTRGFGDHDGHPRYRGEPAMTAVAKHLARDLPVYTGVRATAVAHDGRLWNISIEDGDTWLAERLIMTTPAPQTLALLDAGKVELPAAARHALDQITYTPCFAVMARLNQPSLIPAPGAVQINSEPITWIADNFQKGISDEVTVTLHAGPAFTRQHLNDQRDTIGRQLLAAAAGQGWLDLAAVEEMQVHRWLYSQPVTLHPDRTLAANTPGPIAFAGDAFKEARVEGAALSGLAAAKAL